MARVVVVVVVVVEIGAKTVVRAKMPGLGRKREVTKRWADVRSVVLCLVGRKGKLAGFGASP